MVVYDLKNIVFINNSKMACNNEVESEVIVVIVPFPAQGHLNQLIHLSRHITSYNIPVHFVGTTTHSRQAKLRLQGWDPSLSTIRFHELPTPSFPSPPPDPHASSKFPSHLLPSFEAAMLLREPVGRLLAALSHEAKRLVVVHDTLMAYVIQDVVSISNGEAYSFGPVSTFRISSNLLEIIGKPPGIDDEILKQMPSKESTVTPEVVEFMKRQEEYRKYSSGVVFNTCRAIEAPFLDFLAKINPKQWAIGPFNPVEVSKNSSDGRHKCFEWLDNQAPNSVIYVSFGTTTCLRDEQIRALAIGLENSDQKFIWVLRDADKADIFDGNARVFQLPDEYEKRIEMKEQGIILRDWAPQLEILSHTSTGGFMSHCGWNSCLESITMGVPMATWPMHSDQPHNALLVTKVLNVGLVVKDWGNGDQMVGSSVIEKAVRKLMASGEGEEIRKRVVELGMAVKRSVIEGGDSRREFDDFIAHISR